MVVTAVLFEVMVIVLWIALGVGVIETPVDERAMTRMNLGLTDCSRKQGV